MLLLDATIVVAGLAGLRRMPASDFFLGPFTTALLPGEILHSVELAPRPGPGAAFTEVSRVHGAFALVGAGALVNLAADDGIAKAEVVLFAVGDRPQRIDWLPEATVGRRLDERLLDELADRIAAWVSPLEDIHAGTEYRRRVSGRLAVRALQTAAHAASVR
jgi:carbon-monoxide dehydrogenase medium subunit